MYKRQAISGDTIIVGANRDDDTVSNSGSAYVYTRTAGVWTLEQKINDLAPGADQFGFDVDILGDTIAIGSLRDSTAAVQAGSAQVWTRTAGVWTFQQKLLPDGTVAGEGFGQSVALDEDVLIVGNIFGEDDTPGNFLGKLHVYERDAGVWTETYELLANDGANNDQLGVSVAVDGPTIVGGTSTHNSFAGAGYIFENYLDACYCSDGVCNQCQTDVDCGFGRTCDTGTCV